MTARAYVIPRKRGLMLRLLVIFLAVALAVGLQAGEGQAAGHRTNSPASAPAVQEVGCAPKVARAASSRTPGIAPCKLAACFRTRT